MVLPLPPSNLTHFRVAAHTGVWQAFCCRTSRHRISTQPRLYGPMSTLPLTGQQTPLSDQTTPLKLPPCRRADLCWRFNGVPDRRSGVVKSQQLLVALGAGARKSDVEPRLEAALQAALRRQPLDYESADSLASSLKRARLDVLRQRSLTSLQQLRIFDLRSIEISEG